MMMKKHFSSLYLSPLVFLLIIAYLCHSGKIGRSIGLSRFASWCVWCALTHTYIVVYVGGQYLTLIFRPSVMVVSPSPLSQYTKVYIERRRRRNDPRDNSRDSSIKKRHETLTRSSDRPKVCNFV